MKPAITAVRLTGSPRRASLPLLVLGPATGRSATGTWAACAPGLADAFDLLAWDLPGHGHNRAVPEEPPTLVELAAGVLDVVDDVMAQRGDAGGSFVHVGAGIGGEVGSRLRLDAPRRVARAVLLEESPAEEAERVVAGLRRLLLGEEPTPVVGGPGLDDRGRALVTLAARVARDPGAVAAHARAARQAGLTAAEVEQVLAAVSSTG